MDKVIERYKNRIRELLLELINSSNENEELMKQNKILTVKLKELENKNKELENRYVFIYVPVFEQEYPIYYYNKSDNTSCSNELNYKFTIN